MPSAWPGSSWSWRSPCTGRCRPACGTPPYIRSPPKKTCRDPPEKARPPPDLALQAWSAPHPAAAPAPRPFTAPLGRLAELMDGKVLREAMRRAEAAEGAFARLVDAAVGAERASLAARQAEVAAAI